MSRFAAGTAAMSLPLTDIEPLSAVSNPARMRSAVVLPQPEGPSRATNSPGAISTDNWSRARIAPNVLVRLDMTTGTPPWLPAPLAVESGTASPGTGSAGLVVFAIIGYLQSPGGSRSPDPPGRRRRAGLAWLPIIVMARRKIHVTNSAKSDAATETGPLVWSKLTIQTGKV